MMDLWLHVNIYELNAGDFPVNAVFHLSSGDVAKSYTANGGKWHDIINDGATSDGVTVDGRHFPLGTWQEPHTLTGSGNNIRVTYVHSPDIPGYPGRIAYWLVIDDM
jgi:hypothetical protein